MFIALTKDGAEKIIREATKEMGKLLFDEPVKVIDYTAQQERVVNVLKKQTFGCNQKHVIELMEALLGVHLPRIVTENIIPVENALVVLLDRSNGHDYPTDKPVLIGNGRVGYYYRSNGSLNNSILTSGNTLPDTRSSYRIATEKEIKSFIDKLK